MITPAPVPGYADLDAAVGLPPPSGRQARPPVGQHRVLARTDRRLMVLSRHVGPWRRILRFGADPLPPLYLRWQCPGADLASATEKAGRLRLTFTDGSAVTLLTPSADVRPFLAG